MNRKLKKDLSVLLILLVFSVFCYAVYCEGVESQEYSADMISHSGGQTVKSKIYFGANKMRTEMPENTVITRLDKNLAWIVMPSEKMYMEQPINRKMLPKTSQKVEGEIERVKLGVENVDGKPAEKYKVTYKDDKNTHSAYQWIRDSKYLVKMEALDGSWGVEYKNLTPGHQPDSLFEPPAGFQKLSMPSMPMGAGGAGRP